MYFTVLLTICCVYGRLDGQPEISAAVHKLLSFSLSLPLFLIEEVYLLHSQTAFQFLNQELEFLERLEWSCGALVGCCLWQNTIPSVVVTVGGGVVCSFF